MQAAFTVRFFHIPTVATQVMKTLRDATLVSTQRAGSRL
jgi:hypothetical protein